MSQKVEVVCRAVVIGGEDDIQYPVVLLQAKDITTREECEFLHSVFFNFLEEHTADLEYKQVVLKSEFNRMQESYSITAVIEYETIDDAEAGVLLIEPMLATYATSL